MWGIVQWWLHAMTSPLTPKILKLKLRQRECNGPPASVTRWSRGRDHSPARGTSLNAKARRLVPQKISDA
ncbi:hypothetical protein BHE74_00017671 [Ensete ventricosum]|nr:hypothetical protein BHE74_00017671 [Ensete ventricosum]